MGRRFDVLPPTTFTSNTQQDVRFAVAIPGGAKSGLLVVNVFAAGSAGDVRIYSGSQLEANPELIMTGSSGVMWFNVGAVTAITTTGVKTTTLTAMADFVRVAVENLTGTLRCSATIFVFDA